MINIRRNLFETNSSSVHSITMCEKDEFNAWVEGKLFFCEANGKFYTRDEMIKYIKRYNLIENQFEYDYNSGTFKYNGEIYNNKDRFEIADKFADIISDEDAEEFYENFKNYNPDFTPLNYEDYKDSVYEEYEMFESEYVTKSGITIIAFGYYGYN